MTSTNQSQIILFLLVFESTGLIIIGTISALFSMYSAGLFF
jgi:hypothetical protein